MKKTLKIVAVLVVGVLLGLALAPRPKNPTPTEMQIIADWLNPKDLASDNGWTNQEWKYLQSIGLVD